VLSEIHIHEDISIQEKLTFRFSSQMGVIRDKTGKERERKLHLLTNPTKPNASDRAAHKKTINYFPRTANGRRKRAQ
jgi:hypothetical protein